MDQISQEEKLDAENEKLDAENEKLDAENFAMDAFTALHNEDRDKIHSVLVYISGLSLRTDFSKKSASEYYRFQKYTECCLKLVLKRLNVANVDTNFIGLLWGSLNFMLNPPFARRYVCRYSNGLVLLKRFILSCIENGIDTDRTILFGPQVLLYSLDCAPSSYFVKVAELNIISLLLKVLETSSSVVLLITIIRCFSMLCTGRGCETQLLTLGVGKTAIRIAKKYKDHESEIMESAQRAFDDIEELKNNMASDRSMPIDHGILLSCSNTKCLLVQKDVEFKKCAQCKLAVYCSKECQVNHWKDAHCKVCKV